MTSLSPIVEVDDETSAAGARIEAAARLRQHEVDLDADLGFPDQPRPMRASTPLPRLGDTTLFSVFNQTVDFPADWMWCSTDTGIRPPSEDELSLGSVESNSTVLMASIDISWASGSLNLDASPESTIADGTAAPSRRDGTRSFDDRSSTSASDEDSFFLDASEGPCLRPARGSGKTTNLHEKSFASLPSLFFCEPFQTLPDANLAAFWQRTPSTWRRIYMNKSKVNFLRAAWSRGKPKRYNGYDFKALSLYISRLLYQGVIIAVKREKNFVSYPFILPKKAGERPRFIVDYGHLRDKDLYTAPTFSLSPILASGAAVATLQHALFFAKVDLRDAFHTMPLPRTLRRVSTFSFAGKYYQYRRLPMGLYISPYLLQTALRALFKGVAQCWVHVDDILIWGRSQQEVREKITRVVRLLHSANFRINTKKSALKPQTTIQYCGLQFESGAQWEFTQDKVNTLRRVLETWDNNRKKRTKRYLGFVTYVLCASGLSAAWAKLIEKYPIWRSFFWFTFCRLPRAWKDKRPRRINWACDAAAGDLAVVDNKGVLQWHATHDEHINIAEAMALLKAAAMMPTDSAIWTDSKVAKGWLRRARSWSISAVLSWITTYKRIQVHWLPSAWNPADAYTRMHPPFTRKIGACQRRTLRQPTTIHECVTDALNCRGL